MDVIIIHAFVLPVTLLILHINNRHTKEDIRIRNALSCVSSRLFIFHHNPS